MRIIATLIGKDLALYFRDRFFALITVLGLVFYAAVYFLMPSEVDETLEIGLYVPEEVPAEIDQALSQEGLSYKLRDSEDDLREDVEEGDFAAGLVLPANSVETLQASETTTLTIYYPPNTSDEARDSIETLFRNVGNTVGGETLTIQFVPEVLGVDKVGNQIPPRDRILPLFAILLLVMETMGLASLITEEVENGTVRALLITPMKTWHLFAGKAIFGLMLAFSEVSLLMLITGGLNNQPLLILTTLLLGALLVTGIGFLLASIAKDMLSVVSWGVLVVIALSIPAFSVMFPGSLSDWVEIIPTHYLVDTVNQVMNFDAGWADVWQNLAILLVVSVAILWAGTLVLERKVR